MWGRGTRSGVLSHRSDTACDGCFPGAAHNTSCVQQACAERLLRARLWGKSAGSPVLEECAQGC